MLHLCSNGHEEIAYAGTYKQCPICEQLDEIAGHISDATDHDDDSGELGVCLGEANKACRR